MADRMTQSQVVKALATANGTSNKAAKTFIESLVELAVSQAKKSGIFVLPGLGRLKKVNRKARMGRNPATGAEIKIPAKTTAKFYLSKAVKDSIAPKKK
jgi:DNA-binding protein HU-beta